MIFIFSYISLIPSSYETVVTCFFRERHKTNEESDPGINMQNKYDIHIN